MWSFEETPEAKSDREAGTARKLIMQFLRGKPLDEIRPKLKSLSTTMDCQARYESIALNPRDNIDNGIHHILNELSIGGAQLHSISLERAREKGYINCYVLDLHSKTFSYISSTREAQQLVLSNKIDFERFMQKIQSLPHYRTRCNTDSRHKEEQSLYLSAENIKNFIAPFTDHSPLTAEQKKQIDNYLDSPNLYTALKKLQPRHPHVAVFCELIEGTKTERPWWRYFLIATSLTAISSTLFYLKDHIGVVEALFEQTLPLISDLLNNTIYLLRTTPLIGVATNGFHLSYTWYQAIIDGSLSDSTKSIKLCFKTLGHLLPIAAYTLSYLAAGSMTIPAMFMFIMAAGIEIIKNIIDIRLLSIEQQNAPLAPASDYNSAVNKVRAETAYNRDLALFNTNLIAHIAITISVITWRVLPPNLHVSLPCVIFAWCATMTKDLRLIAINNSSANQLQTGIDSIYNARGKHEEIKADRARAQMVVDGFKLNCGVKKAGPPINTKQALKSNGIFAPEPNTTGARGLITKCYREPVFFEAANYM